MSNAHSERHRSIRQAVRHERELREAEKAAFDHERELRSAYDDHERELRLQAEAAVEKARALQFAIYEQRLEAMNQYREQLQEQAKTFMAVDRWEREHKNLRDSLTVAEKALMDRVTRLETAGTRTESRSELMETLATNRRWLYGILVTVLLFGATTLLHAFGVI